MAFLLAHGDELLSEASELVLRLEPLRDVGRDAADAFRLSVLVAERERVLAEVAAGGEADVNAAVSAAKAFT